MTAEQEKRLEEIRASAVAHHDEVLGSCGDELLDVIDSQQGEIQRILTAERRADRIVCDQLTAAKGEIEKLTKTVEAVLGETFLPHVADLESQLTKAKGEIDHLKKVRDDLEESLVVGGNLDKAEIKRLKQSLIYCDKCSKCDPWKDSEIASKEEK